MRWGSFDPFLLGDAFWQDKMGMPVANKGFLQALLRHGTFESYHFFCEDKNSLSEFERSLDQIVPAPCQSRVKVSLQAMFTDELRKSPIDIMHHGDFTYYMPYLMEFRNRMFPAAPMPATGVTHSLDTVQMHRRFLDILLAKPRPFDTIVCTSNCGIEMLKRSFDHIRNAFKSDYGADLPQPPSFARIPLGLPEESYAPQDKAECRDQLGIPRQNFVMLSLARFSPRRKMDLSPLLECIQWLKSAPEKEFPAFTLILAGAGRAADLKLAHDIVTKLGLQGQVRVEGNIPVEKKRLFYGAADVFLSLVDNYQETFGITLLEAMAQGLPVVASDFNGYRELVVHGLTGFLIPTYMSINQEPWDSLMGMLSSSVHRFYRAQKVSFDLAKLAEALCMLASRPDLRAGMGARARTRAMPYQWRWIIAMYEELWKSRRREAESWIALNRASRNNSPYLTPSTEVSFSHFPAVRLHPKTFITLSDYGRQRSREAFQPVMYEDTAALLDEISLAYLTDRASRRSWMLAELLSEAQCEPGCTEETAVLHLDWLLKHGYLTVHPETD